MDGLGYPSLAFDPADQPAIAYNGRLARFDGSVWRIETLRPVGAWSSLAFDGLGNPVIAAYAGDSVRLARWNRAAWETETVDPAGWASGGLSLAFSELGLPAISYTDRSNLKLASWDGRRWSFETVDGPDTGWHSSLRFDGAGRAAISYLERSGGALKHALRDGAAWTIETVDGPGLAAIALALVAADRPVISYQAGSTLRLAHRDASGWTTRSVHGLSLRVVSHGSGRGLRGGGARSPLPRSVSALVPGWRSAAFPLNATDDDETPPFPIDVALALTGGSERDDLASGRPLVLYRILRDDGEGAGNLLRITKDAAGVTIRF